MCRVNGKSYVGQTWFTIAERHGDFRQPPEGMPALCNAVKKHGWDAFDKFSIEEWNTQAELDEAEQFWIAYLRTIAPNGYNLRGGGSGGGAFNSTALRRLMGKAVTCFDLTTGIRVATYPTMVEAAKAVGCPKQSISMVCRGKIKTTGGYTWRYADPSKTDQRQWSVERKMTSQRLRQSSVKQIDRKTGEIIAVYPSVSAAVIATGAHHIAHVCSGDPTRHHAGGFKWEWAELSQTALRTRAARAAKKRAND